MSNKESFDCRCNGIALESRQDPRRSTWEGRLIGSISGQVIPATPEEVGSVQPFARQLVEGYVYPRNLMRTRPQWHVKARPTDRTKSYLADIAVSVREC